MTLADPAVGTGTFILGVLRRIAADVEADQGAGAVPQAIESAIGRLIAFEMQLGPFAVAQLRVYAELIQLIGKPPRTAPRMFVTDTLGKPVRRRWNRSAHGTARSPNPAGRPTRSSAKEPITVVIGNPPYKEKAKGRGGWIEEGDYAGGKGIRAAQQNGSRRADWGVGAHAKHLRNLYVYFWRWATWKVFDHDPKNDTGIVCFITVAGFLNGPGFQRMRDYLRRTADRIWVIDCSPEGHQPDVQHAHLPGRAAAGLHRAGGAVRRRSDADAPAAVKYTRLPAGKREEKVRGPGQAQARIEGWQDCPTDWRAPFLPAATGEWATYPALDDLFAYNGSGVHARADVDHRARCRIIAAALAEADSRAKPSRRRICFIPHLRNGKLGDGTSITS